MVLRWTRIGTLAMAMAAIGLMGRGVASAETYYVDADWTGEAKGTAEQPFTTLGQAVAAYVEGSGHTIKVAGGVYKAQQNGGQEAFGEAGYELQAKDGTWRGGYRGWDGESFNWDEGARVVPAGFEVDEQAMTVVDLKGANARAFHVSNISVEVVFEGFVFRNSKVTRKAYDGGALFLDGGRAPSRVNDCLFVNNQTTGDGGALVLSGNGGTSRDCYFIGNEANNGGGARIAPDTSTQTIVGFVFRENRAKGQGGGLYRPGHNVVVRQSRFIGNVAGELGGGIGGNGGRTNVEQTTFHENRAKRGAAIGGQAYGGPPFNVVNCLFTDNTATGEEGTIVASYGGCCGAELRVDFCTFVGNRAPGGLIFNQRSNRGQKAPMTVRNCIMVGDPGDGAEATGVGVNTDDDKPDVHHNLVWRLAEPYAMATGPGEGSLNVDPRFRNAEEGDYRPRMDGPAINVAADLGVKIDLNGNRRPYNDKDRGIDLGCHEVAPVPRDTVLLLR